MSSRSGPVLPRSRTALSITRDARSYENRRSEQITDSANVVSFSSPSGTVAQEHRHRQPVDPLAQRAEVVRQLLRQHGNDAVGQVDARAAPVRLAVERRVGEDVVRDIGDVHAEQPVLVATLERDGVVEVARGHRVDRDDRGRLPQIEALARLLRTGRFERLGFVPRLLREARRDPEFGQDRRVLDGGVSRAAEDAAHAEPRLRRGHEDLVSPPRLPLDLERLGNAMRVRSELPVAEVRADEQLAPARVNANHAGGSAFAARRLDEVAIDRAALVAGRDEQVVAPRVEGQESEPPRVPDVCAADRLGRLTLRHGGSLASRYRFRVRIAAAARSAAARTLSASCSLAATASMAATCRSPP